MILHVLNDNSIEHDYMVGAQLEGFECMVKLTKTAKIAVVEGDEYLSSPIDRRPKFHLYRPNIALMSGIAWDHINVFPTFENYVEQFQIFVDLIEPNGTITYCELDEHVNAVCGKAREDVNQIPYATHAHRIENGVTYIQDGKNEYALEIFGNHNLQNLTGALNVCVQLGLSKESFYKSIQTFTGASKRLELVKRTQSNVMYKDFAHSPSKLKATTQALKKQFPDRKLIACMELHTFSSLNKEFLDQYDGAMETADEAYIYYSPETIAHKRLDSISPDEIKKAFNSSNVTVFDNSDNLLTTLKKRDWSDSNLLMMSSGNFNGVDFEELGNLLF
jgi:UDP-N-acetylmuramate: L-alanyl-gamma-D-glutamyl-meso-diaminopimelate ligase